MILRGAEEEVLEPHDLAVIHLRFDRLVQAATTLEDRLLASPRDVD
jgi:hypothetical protein